MPTRPRCKKCWQTASRQPDTNRAGQIATGFSWKFYAVCDLDTAARFDGLSTVKISVPGKQNTPLSATVEEVTEDKDNGIAKIVLPKCQTINAGFWAWAARPCRSI